MNILVLNAGSSSLKFGVFNLQVEDCRVFKGEFEQFQAGQCALHFRVGGERGSEQHRTLAIAGLSEAFKHLPVLLEEFGFSDIDAIGHRVAHGGERFKEATLIDDEVLAFIESCTPLAPLHNPANLQGIYTGRGLWPGKPQVAVFDTSFHQTVPASAYTYAIPREWRELGVRRYGFHGTSHKYVGLRAAQALQTAITDLRIISCHLGNGASVCAINHGVSIDTSMGMTPLEGLVMGTRSGDVDPGLFAYLSQHLGLSSGAVEHQLYVNSGLKALAGSQDLRDIEPRAMQGDADAQLAINVYAYRVRKYIGAYAAAMGGLDAIVFTGGIGENSASMRQRICEQMQFLGLSIDTDKNRELCLSGFDAPRIDSSQSRVKVLVTQTCEQLMIARETAELLARRSQPDRFETWQIPVAVSARHVHLSAEAVTALFGDDYRLSELRPLKQPGSWAAQETVDVIGPRGELHHVRILGPLRSATQIEVSRTDCFALGVEAPVRPSGKLENTPRVRLRGPAGEYTTTGLIVAARHIHMSDVDAAAHGLNDGDYVNVTVGQGPRGVAFANTMIRVSDQFVTEMHIDTDEANAADIGYSTSTNLVIDHGDHAVKIDSKHALTLTPSV